MIWTLNPDYATPPGDTLAETLETLGMSQTELARRMGRPIKTINEIIQAKAAITPDTALELERVLPARASYWNQLEINYREHLARKRANEELSVDEEWLKQLPIKDLQRRGCLPEGKDKSMLMEAALRFFGVAGRDEWGVVWQEPLVQYRKSPAFEANAVAIAAWIRQGELEGRKQQCAPYDAAKFRQTLNELRALTLKEPSHWVRELQSACRRCGVAYVFIPEFPHCHVSGATRWLRDDCALVLQSGRHKDDGHFWFTFFHEAKHVLQGRQRKTWTIEVDGMENDPLEIDANSFAAEHLVPSKRIAQMRRENGGKMPMDAVKKLAKDLGIAEGIVAGHFQHEGIWKPMLAARLLKRFTVDPVRGTIS